jgi:hypothetical protein
LLNFKKIFEAFFESAHDDNKGRGYGLTKNVFHKPRKANSAYPYVDKDNLDAKHAEEFHDEETEKAINSKVLTVYKTDPLAYKSVDPFYFVAGNTKLSDCFYRTDKVLEEINALDDSLSPISNLIRTKKKNYFVQRGASFPSGVGSLKRTGTTRGYASSSPRLKIDNENREEDQGIENLADLADKQTKSSGTFSKRKDIFNR